MNYIPSPVALIIGLEVTRVLLADFLHSPSQDVQANYKSKFYQQSSFTFSNFVGACHSLLYDLARKLLSHSKTLLKTLRNFA